MFRHIRSRFAAALALPLAVLLGLAGLGIATSLQREDSARQARTTATAALSPTGLISALQNERNETSLQLLGLDKLVNLGVSSVSGARAATGLAESDFRSAVAASASASRSYAPALAVLGQLPHVRGQADAFDGPRSVEDPAATVRATEVYDGYTAVITRLLDAGSRIAPTFSDGTLRTGAEALDASLRQSEAQAQVVHDVFDASFAGGFAAVPGLAGRTGADLGTYDAWTARLAGLEQMPYTLPVAQLADPAAASRFDSVVQGFLAGGRPDLLRLLGATAAGVGGGGATTPYKAATLQVSSLAQGRAAALVHAAARQVWLLGALAALVLLFGVVVILRISHRISAPLTALARQAEELAAHRLSGAVRTILHGGTPGDADLPAWPRSGTDEVAAVSGALAAVQGSAISLAVEQAALRRNLSDALTNLGRRNQNLVTRQLDYISAVEKAEADPDKLEQLFRLDHLATRMRRNAESLLVLGGAESPRQWSAPVAAVDVVRSSLAEVEEFRRVRLGTIEPTTVLGQATADVAHLLAELLENSLVNSPPHAPVVVEGASVDGGYALRIVDRGIGMTGAALEAANLRLAGAESFVEGASRYLGLYVAGRLAARHGIRVTLRPGDGAGLVAEVLLPGALLPEGATAPGTPPQAAAVPSAPTTTPSATGTGRARRPVVVPEAAAEVAEAPVPDEAAAPTGRRRLRLATPAPRRRRVAADAAAATQDAPDVPAPAPLPEPAAVARVLDEAPEPPAVAVAPTPPVAPAPEPSGLPARGVPAAPPTTAAPTAVAPAPPVGPPPAAAPRVTEWVPSSPIRSTPSPSLVAQAQAQAEVVAAPAPTPEASPAADFESWLNSRLDQLEALSLDQAVTAAPATPSGEAAAAPTAAAATADVDALVAGLPRRRPVAADAGPSSSLLRRDRSAEAGEAPAAEAAAPEAGAEAEPAVKVSSSLFRYLAAVERPQSPR